MRCHTWLALLATCALSHSPAHGQTFPADADWVVVKHGGVAIVDGTGDGPTGDHDIVSTTEASAQVWSDGAFVYFRLRVDATPLFAGDWLNNHGWGVQIDLDGIGGYDYMALLDGGANAINLWKNTTPAIAWDPLDVSETLLWTYPTSTHARSVSDGSADFFVDFAIPLAALGAVPSPARLVFGTNSSRQALLTVGVSGDIAGIPNSTANFTNAISDTVMCAFWGGCGLVEVTPAPVGALDLRVTPSPSRDVGLTASLALPTASPAVLELFDVRGRRLSTQATRGPGAHTVSIAAGRRLPPGIYWVRLRQDTRQVTRRAVVIR